MLLSSRLLDELDKTRKNQKILIFTQTKRAADGLTHQLRRDGFVAKAIHGDKSQSERDWSGFFMFLLYDLSKLTHPCIVSGYWLTSEVANAPS